MELFQKVTDSATHLAGDESKGSILGRVLLAYCSQVAKRPKRLLFFYVLCAVVPLVVGILFRGFALETDFNAFIKADGSAMRDREAYQLAYEEKKDLTGGRRLEVKPFLQVDEWIEEVEVEDEEGVRRLLEENYTTAPGRRLRTLFLRKELQLLYRAKNGNILDDKALQDIQRIEEGFRNLPGMRNLCYTRITSEAKRFLCDPGVSVVAMAFPTQSSSSQGRAFLEFTWDGMGRDLVPPAAVLAYMKAAADLGDPSRTSRRYFPKTWTYPDVGDFQADPAAMPDAARTKFSYHLTLGQNGDPVSQVNANIGKTKDEWNALINTEMLPYFHGISSGEVDFYYASTDIDSIEVAGIITAYELRQNTVFIHTQHLSRRFAAGAKFTGMALLQCCFESADYVELIQLEDETQDGHVTRTLSKIQEMCWILPANKTEPPWLVRELSS
eukprot:s678_g27.t1